MEDLYWKVPAWRSPAPSDKSPAFLCAVWRQVMLQGCGLRALTWLAHWCCKSCSGCWKCSASSLRLVVGSDEIVRGTHLTKTRTGLNARRGTILWSWAATTLAARILARAARVLALGGHRSCATATPRCTCCLDKGWGAKPECLHTQHADSTANHAQAGARNSCRCAPACFALHLAPPANRSNFSLHGRTCMGRHARRGIHTPLQTHTHALTHTALRITHASTLYTWRQQAVELTCASLSPSICVSVGGDPFGTSTRTSAVSVARLTEA